MANNGIPEGDLRDAFKDWQRKKAKALRARESEVRMGAMRERAAHESYNAQKEFERLRDAFVIGVVRRGK